MCGHRGSALAAAGVSEGAHARWVCGRGVGTAGVWLFMAIEAALLPQLVCQKGCTHGGCVAVPTVYLLEVPIEDFVRRSAQWGGGWGLGGSLLFRRGLVFHYQLAAREDVRCAPSPDHGIPAPPSLFPMEAESVGSPTSTPRHTRGEAARRSGPRQATKCVADTATPCPCPCSCPPSL